MNVTVQQAADKLCGADNILILTHRRPDGDTTGCAGGLCRGLRSLGKTACVLENPDLTERYRWLIAPLAQPEGFTPDFIVSVDISEGKMLPENAASFADRVDLVIDHHCSNQGFGKYNLVRPEAGGCCEVVYDVLMALGVTLTKEIAEAIYVGVSTDTGCFKFSNTVTHTHEVAAACLATGLDCGELNRQLFEIKSRRRLSVERLIIETIEFYRDGAISVALLRRSDLDKIGADNDDLDSIASIARQVEGVQVGLTFTENKDGTVRVSARTAKEVDAARLCERFGGGGHLRAAGATFPAGVSLEEAKRQTVAYAEELYDKSGL